MKPQISSRTLATLHTKQDQAAPGLVENAQFCVISVAHSNGHPTFSEESSQTEYTSPDPSDDSANLDSVQSLDKEVYFNGTGSALKSSAPWSPKSTELHNNDIMEVSNPRSSDICPSEKHTYSSPLVGKQKFFKLAESSYAGHPSAGFCAKESTVQTNSLPPARNIKVFSTCSTRKERYEKDANGNTRVIVDLGDSDEELEVRKSTPPLCSNCHGLQSERQQGRDLKVKEKTVVNRENIILVVDLTKIQSPVVRPDKRAAIDITPLKNERKPVAGQAPSMAKSTGKEDLITNLQSAVEHAEILEESTCKLQLGSGMSTAAMKRTSQRTRRLVSPEDEDEPKPSKKDGRKVESEDEASTLSGNYERKHGEEHVAELILPDWSQDVKCDLCERGPSLSLGAWYCWCCGAPSQGCTCSPEELWRKKSSLKWKSGKIWRSNDPVYPWSGKVHRLCGLWSCEVYEDEGPARMLSLYNAVQRGKRIKCSDPDCGLFGATLGCRVRSCKKNYHYPCADRLSSYLKVRMWDGLRLPIACKEHRHLDAMCDIKSKKKRKRGSKGGAKGKDTEEALACENKNDEMGSGDWKSKSAGIGVSQWPNFTKKFNGVGTSKQGVKTPGGSDVIDLFSSDEEQSPNGCTGQGRISHSNTPGNTRPGIAPTGSFEMPDSWPEPLISIPGYLGKKLLCADFSGGLEPIVVPCTNDVDNEPSPSLEYITKSRYKGLPLGSKGCSHPLLKKLAKACKGCAKYELDDPTAPLSVHIPFQHREDDFREDWQRERMHGRLPYDKYARLMIGTDYNELVECNPRCGCGDSCINREMQRGLRTPIELYKTVYKGWAVRTLVSIPRGRFVIEYVGEMLTQDQAHEFGQIYDDLKRSYLYDLDYPESKRKPEFTLDGFHASNVARFINHSCDANLKIYRVYVETTNKWFSHIGMYAMRDIEAGEELSYDYNYGMHNHEPDNKIEVNGEQQSETFSDDQEKDSTHIKCYCGARNCRKWLWRPPVTDTDSVDEEVERCL